MENLIRFSSDFFIKNQQLCRSINFVKREFNKGIVYNLLVQKGFFLRKHNIWQHVDFSFPYSIQFSNHDNLNAVKIYNSQTGKLIANYKYTATKWINYFLDNVDRLLLTYKCEPANPVCVDLNSDLIKIF